jgi:small subunit ribosomal protein S1
MSDIFLPEGRLLNTPENCRLCASAAGLRKAMERQIILEGSALMAKPDLTLQVAVGPFMGEIPREETAAGIAEGYTRDIAVLSRVGKTICFVVDRLEERDGALVPILSRRRAQERAKVWLEGLAPGTVLPVTVTHLEPFGAFVDAGCGVSSLICVERISISRIPHPDRRFRVGDEIYAAVLEQDRENRRVRLTHRELLGTWAENARSFCAGMTVPGIARSVLDYGIFVELTPNLSGLAELREGISEGDRVSVFVKAVLPQRLKCKLLILDKLPPAPPLPCRYFLPQGGRMTRWDYAPAGVCRPGAQTVFEDRGQ